MRSSATNVFKALAHPARREILSMLSVSDRSVKQITLALQMSQPAVSQHLRQLRKAKLVAPRKIGSQQQYRFTGEPLKIVFDWCAQYQRFFDPSGHAWEFTPIEADQPSTGKRRRTGGR